LIIRFSTFAKKSIKLKEYLERLKKQQYFYPFLRFICIYTTARVLFWCYIGVLYPQGKYYWPFLSHINIVQWIRTALAYPVSWIMNLTENKTVPFNLGVLFLKCVCGILIEFPCLGIQVMIAYAALILAFSAPYRYLYLVSGLLLIHILNIMRMVGIMLMQVHHIGKKIDMAHDTFNVVAYGVIIFLFYRYINGGIRKT
jgi:exosortase/archaeosortase family protein